jgi:hypothetical protein
MTSQGEPAIVDMERLLVRSAESFDYPRTPDVAAAVAARLRAPEPLRTGLSTWFRPQFTGAYAAALVAVVAIVLAVPASRTALAEFFGLDNLEITVGPDEPGLPTLSPDHIGRETTLGEAEAALGFAAALPDGRRPDAVYVVDDAQGAAGMVLVYKDEAFELWQTKRLNFLKRIPNASFVHEVDVGGATGFWIEPGHSAALESTGLEAFHRGVDRGVLLWQRRGTTYRLETDSSQAEAVEIAKSLR